MIYCVKYRKVTSPVKLLYCIKTIKSWVRLALVSSNTAADSVANEIYIYIFASRENTPSSSKVYFVAHSLIIGKHRKVLRVTYFSLIQTFLSLSSAPSPESVKIQNNSFIILFISNITHGCYMPDYS